MMNLQFCNMCTKYTAIYTSNYRINILKSSPSMVFELFVERLTNQDKPGTRSVK